MKFTTSFIAFIAAFAITISSVEGERRSDIAGENECKNFYSDGLKYLPKCANDPLMKKLIESIKETQNDFNIHYCTVTSDGKICPLVLNTNEGDTDTSKLIDENYKLDCEYQVCIDSFIKYAQTQKKYSELIFEMFNAEGTFDQVSEDEYYDGILKFLQSSECVAKNKDQGKLITSGATSIKAFGSLLSIILLFVLF